MAWAITVNGVNVTTKFEAGEGQLTMSFVLNQRAVLSMSAVDQSETFRPSRFQTITVAKDGTTLFSGLILRVSLAAMPRKHNRVLVSLEAVDFNYYLDAKIVEVLSIAASSTLYQLLTTLTGSYFSAYGITLSASQANPGYTFTTTQRWDRVTLKTLLDDVAAISGHLGWVNQAKEYRMVSLANAPAAAWNISDATRNHEEMTVTSLGDEYFNWVQVEGGRAGQALVLTDHWGPGWTAGADTTGSAFILNCHFWPSVDPPPGYVTVDGSNLPVGIYPGDLWSSLWTWERSGAYPYARLHYGPGPLLTNAVVSINVNVVAPFIVENGDTAEITAKGGIMRRFTAPGATDHYATAGLAAGHLARGIANARVITYTTKTDGLLIGTKQHIESSMYGVDGDFIITGIDTANLPGGSKFRHTVTAVDQDSYRASWLDRWQQRGVGA